MFTTQVFFAMFNKLETEADRKEFKLVYEQFNHEVYGYTNEQAHRFQSVAPSYQDQVRSIATADTSL